MKYYFYYIVILWFAYIFRILPLNHWSNYSQNTTTLFCWGFAVFQKPYRARLHLLLFLFRLFLVSLDCLFFYLNFRMNRFSIKKYVHIKLSKNLVKIDNFMSVDILIQYHEINFYFKNIHYFPSCIFSIFPNAGFVLYFLWTLFLFIILLCMCFCVCAQTVINKFFSPIMNFK